MIVLIGQEYDICHTGIEDGHLFGVQIGTNQIKSLVLKMLAIPAVRIIVRVKGKYF